MSFSEKFWLWVAYRIPKPLVYWCVIRAINHATTGKYSGEIVPEVTAFDVLTRWGLSND